MGSWFFGLLLPLPAPLSTKCGVPMMKLFCILLFGRALGEAGGKAAQEALPKRA